MHLVLSITDRCNLDCGYCHVKKGGTTLTPADVRRKLEAAVPEGCEELSLLLFGGEPTLNVPALYAAADYLRERGLRSYVFTLSNGTAEMDVYKRLIDNRVRVFVSADSVEPDKDSVRRGNGTNGSVNIDELIKYSIGKDVPFKVRATVHEGNVHELGNFVAHWADLGVRYVHFEAASPTVKRSKIKSPSAKEYTEAVKAAVEEGDSRGTYIITSPFMNLLNPGTHFCKSLCEGQYLLGVDGTVSSCFRVQKLSEDPGGFIIGSVDGKENGLVFKPDELQSRWSGVDDRLKCRECSVRYFCGGGCPYRNLLRTGDINEPDPWHCEVLKSLVPFGLEKVRGAVKKHGTTAVLGIYYLEYEMSAKPTVGLAREQAYTPDTLLEPLTNVPDTPNEFAAILSNDDWSPPYEILRRTEGCA